jgi:hypothetical protein
MKFSSSLVSLFLLAALSGAILGVLNSKYIFVGSSLSLIPWTIVGLVWGWMSQSYRKAAAIGTIYGFCLTLAFMIAGYAGHNPWLQVAIFFIVVSLFGAACGAILGLMGYGARHFISRPASSDAL